MTLYELPKLYHPDFAVKNRKPVGAVTVEQSPLLRDVVSLTLHNHPSSRENGFINNVPITLGSAAAYGADGSGSFISATGGVSGAYVENCAALKANRTAFSYFIGLKVDPGSSRIIMPPGGTNQFVVWWYVGSLYCFVRNVAGTTFRTPSTGSAATLTDNKFHVIGFTHDSATTTTRLYLDGVLVAERTDTAADLRDNVGVVPRQGHNGSLGNIESIYFTYEWDRALSGIEAEYVSNNYYDSVFQPAIPLTYFVPAAAPAGGNEPLFYHHQRMLSRCS